MIQRSTKLAIINRLIDVYYRTRMRLKWTPKLARAYASWLGVDIGADTFIFGRVSFGSEPWLIRIGRDTWVTYGVTFITHDGSIATINNGPYGIANPEAINRYGKIVIGNNCFIGMMSIILPNVEIGDNSIVGAGSVVTKNVAKGSIVGGNPARVIGNVQDFANKVQKESLPIPSKWPNAETKRMAIRKYFFND